MAVTNYVLLSLTIFVVVTRLITMCVLKRRPDFGDLFSIVAAVGCPGPINILFFIVMCTKHPSKARSQVLALLQSVIVQLAINHGLGRHRDKISSSNFVLFSKVSSLIPSYSCGPADLEIQVRVCRRDLGHSCACLCKNFHRTTYSTIDTTNSVCTKHLARYDGCSRMGNFFGLGSCLSMWSSPALDLCSRQMRQEC